jgi:DNA helicase-2/ATP-dependent DNA helicase PcrA
MDNPIPDAGGLRPPQTVIDFKAQLNPAQYEAVTTTDGPILVVAGAGSGKTRTLVYRVAYLVENGVPPEAVLLLTFTRKAAGEMLSRAETLVGNRCALVSGGTFHSLANLLLRRYADRIGYPPSYGVMDRGDMEEVLGRLRKSEGMGEKDRRFPKRSTLATVISKAANKALSIEELLLSDYIHLMDYARELERLSVLYQSYKRESALMDFDDLLTELARLLETDAEARDRIAGSYRYIMVDEYQDTNPVQARIVYALSEQHRNVMVVGDDAQSIYSFRGASFRNIMDFPKRFPETRVIRLEENYRSRQPILEVTNHIIAGAREKYDKKLFTRRGGGQRPRLVVVGKSKEQSLFVCERIRELIDQGVDASQIAVLFRAASHSFDLEVELSRYGIDFVKFGGRRFLESAHIKDLLSLLRVTANPSDAVSLTRALLLLDGVGPKNATKVVSFVAGKRENLIGLDQYPAKGKMQQSLIPVALLWADIGRKNVSLAERVDKAWDFYRPIMEIRFDDWPQRINDVNEFLRLSKGYTNMTRFLTDMTLEPPNSQAPGGVMGFDRKPLTLSTVHSAKGLEWKVVFIIWATDGRFPPPYAMNSPEELDEERRLMYVAATRAEDELFLICPLESDDYRAPVTLPRPSRFLAEVPQELFDITGDENPAPARMEKPIKREYNYSPPKVTQAARSNGPAPPPPDGFGPGDRVVHKVFGLGRVINLVGNDKIRVDFDHFGEKVLKMQYAGLVSAGG